MLRYLILAFLVLAAPAAAQPADSQSALDGLLAAERALAEAAGKLEPADGIASLLAQDGVLFTRPAPVTGPAAAAAALKANPANKGKFAKWRSIRSGVSADGLHGFTLGYVTIDGGDPATANRRYLAYWVKGDAGWRVAVMKQIIQGPNDEYAPLQAPALPARMVGADPAKAGAHQLTLAAAEKAFSDRAQVVGVTQSFQEYGRPDAVHIFGAKGFAIGLPAIKANQESQPGPALPAGIEWSADRVIVASSGDLGVTLGHIRRTVPVADPPPGAPTGPIPFFTIWRRDDPSRPWKYIAE